MLPCQSRCPQYYEGCHKTCAAWKKYRAASAEDHRRRRAYLDYYSRLCARCGTPVLEGGPSLDSAVAGPGF